MVRSLASACYSHALTLPLPHLETLAVTRGTLIEEADRHPQRAPARKPIGKIAFLAVVIIAAVGWTIYLLASSGPVAVEAPPAQAGVVRITQELAKEEFTYQFVSVVLEGEPPNQNVLVSGSVKTKAALDDLTAAVGVSAGAIPVRIDVAIKP